MGKPRRRWSRYSPPSDLRTEDGGSVEPTTPRSPATPSKPPTSRSGTAPTTPGGRATGGRSGWLGTGKAWLIGFGLAGLAVVIAIVIAANSDDGSSSSSDLDRDLLDADFIADTLSGAEKTVGEQAVTIALRPYEMSVEFYDPNTDENTTYTTDDHTDGYTLRVEANQFDDYSPRPFDIAEVDPDILLSVTEDAIGRTEDPYSFDVTVEVDRETGDPVIEVRVYPDDEDIVTVTTDLDGDEISTE